jgi:hypothetical protein
MTRFSMIAIAICLAIAPFGGSRVAVAQVLTPSAPTLPPPPAAPPPPKIEVPAVPQMDVPQGANLAPQPRSSFGDRVTNCLHEGAAAGLNAGDRATYSRSCANQ